MRKEEVVFCPAIRGQRNKQYYCPDEDCDSCPDNKIESYAKSPSKANLRTTIQEKLPTQEDIDQYNKQREEFLEQVRQGCPTPDQHDKFYKLHVRVTKRIGLCENCYVFLKPDKNRDTVDLSKLNTTKCQRN